VKLLFDANLSWRLVQRLSDLFPESTHVRLQGLTHASDELIWEYAEAGEFTIVTADADFYELATASGPPPKVIWLRGCDYPTAVAERLLRSQTIRIVDFLHDDHQAVLILMP
jgi:predicted nuclease of predicted toxin-antitoxin system